jgi:hypothetical protein
MGFGISSENSRSRIPRPPQNRTTFIEILSMDHRLARPDPEGFVGEHIRLVF